MLAKTSELQNIIQIRIDVAGRVTQSDIIGAVFGQTEEVLGDNLDLRQLQRENKIGRIEVEVEYNDRGTVGVIIIPSYMDVTNSVVIAAALETIQKIGPCKATAHVDKIENIKDIKRKKIVEHAKKVLERFMSISVESQELVDKVTSDVQMGQVTLYGENLGEGGVPAGPQLDHFEDVIFVETVEELKNLLKYGIKNVVAFEDCSKQKTLADIATRKEVTIFINKGKEYVVRKLLEFCDIDNYTKPEEAYKRIVELNSKELFKAIRSAISTEQILQRSQQYAQRFESREQRPVPREEKRVEEKVTTPSAPASETPEEPRNERSTTPLSEPPRESRYPQRQREERGEPPRDERRPREQPRFELPEREKTIFSKIKAELPEGQVALLDRAHTLLGQIPVDALAETLESLNNVNTVVMKGKASQNILSAAERARARYIVADGSEGYARYVRVVSV